MKKYIEPLLLMIILDTIGVFCITNFVKADGTVQATLSFMWGIIVGLIFK